MPCPSALYGINFLSAVHGIFKLTTLIPQLCCGLFARTTGFYYYEQILYVNIGRMSGEHGTALPSDGQYRRRRAAPPNVDIGQWLGSDADRSRLQAISIYPLLVVHVQASNTTALMWHRSLVSIGADLSFLFLYGKGPTPSLLLPPLPLLSSPLFRSMPPKYR